MPLSAYTGKTIHILCVDAYELLNISNYNCICIDKFYFLSRV